MYRGEGYNTARGLISREITQLRADRILGDTVRLIAKNNSYEFLDYKISYSLYDDTLHDGYKCKDYTKMESSYGNCVENHVKQKLLKWYGCVPQWFPGDIDKCSTSNKTLEDETYAFFAKFANNKKINTDCKPSCLKWLIG